MRNGFLIPICRIGTGKLHNFYLLNRSGDIAAATVKASWYSKKDKNVTIRT